MVKLVQDMHLDYEMNQINAVARATDATSSPVDADVGTLFIGLGRDGVLWVPSVSLTSNCSLNRCPALVLCLVCEVRVLFSCVELFHSVLRIGILGYYWMYRSGCWWWKVGRDTKFLPAFVVCGARWFDCPEGNFLVFWNHVFVSN